MSIPSQQTQWRLNSTGPSLSGLVQETAPVPSIGDSDVLVKVHAISLNYRDLLIGLGKYSMGDVGTPIPVSDGAGQVAAVGKQVTRWKVGDRVMPTFIQGLISGLVDNEALSTSLGGQIDGVAREYAAFSEHGLVRIPKGWSYEQAATLPCAALTAWNSLFGLEGRRLMPGEWVLTQGTGGVSIFAVQFAKLAGARVIATTSSEAKAERLKSLGADEVINYRTTPEWSVPAKEVSGKGVNHVVEVGGPGTLAQSLKAVRPEGVISVVGLLDTESGDTPSAHAALPFSCILRGIKIGSRTQFEDMVAAIEGNGMEPVVDEKVFKFDDLVSAYEYLKAQKHFGKVVVTV